MNTELSKSLKFKESEFNSTLPRKAGDVNHNKIKPYKTLNRSSVSKDFKNKTPNRKSKYSEKKRDDIMKTIYNSIKRNEERMNLAQKNLFSNMINEEIIESSNGLYEKLDRAIHTYNEKLQNELVNHINLSLKIA